ncbi:MAG: hypothetical protein ACM3X9_06960 [Bacillota bacterium]
MVLLVTLLVLVFLAAIVFGFYRRQHQSKKIAVFALPTRPNWAGFQTIPKKIRRLQDNILKLDISGNKGDLGEEDYIRREFERQIVEIERISKAAEGFKLAEIKRAFDEYSRKRRNELNEEYRKKSQAVTASLNRDLQQKSIETKELIKNCYHDLEQAHQEELVNLELRLAVLDFNNSSGKAVEKNKLEARIAQIRDGINREGARKKDALQRELALYEKQRRDQADIELKNIQTELQIQLEQDLAAYQASQKRGFDEWQAKQAAEFAKAIKVRRAQSEKQYKK